MKLSPEVKQMIIDENNAFKEKQYGNMTAAERKKLGAVYTPGKLVIELIESFSCDTLAGQNILDPTCGSGNLLAGCLIAGADPDKLFGNELNEEMVKLCRKRLWAICDMLGKKRFWYYHIHQGNALDPRALTDFSEKYCREQSKARKLAAAAQLNT